ncbi:MAG: DUF2341 domain-containing protein, partial [Myxococcota bacterium]
MVWWIVAIARAASPAAVEVWIDTAGLPEPLTEFPVPLRLVRGVAIRPSTAEDGEGLRFVDDEGVRLPSWIEAWDPSDTSVVWVRVPRLDPSGPAHLWMYDDEDPADPPPPGVFGDAAGAWPFAASDPHENQVADDGILMIGLFDEPAEGVVADGTSMSHLGAALVVSPIDLGFEVPPATVSWWWRRDGWTGLERLVEADDALWWVGRCPGGRGLQLGIAGAPGYGCTTDPVDDGAWHHTAVVIDEAEIRLYVDARFGVGAPGAVPAMTGALTVGRGVVGDTDFDGDIDDLREY